MFFSRGSNWNPSKRQNANATVALTVAVHILAIHRHLCAMTDYTFDHGGDFRRRRTFQLRVDAQALLLDVPVDHDPASAVADVPLCGEVLVPGAEMSGVGGTSSCSVTPDRRVADVQRAVGDDRNRLPEPVGRDVAATCVGQFPIARTAMAREASMRFRPAFVPSPCRHNNRRGRRVARSSVS